MSLSTSISTRLHHQHETLDELIEGFTEQQLKQRVYADKWSAFEQVAHLTAYQPSFIDRLQKIQQGNSPSFDRYVAENDPLFHECCNKSLNELTAILHAQRRQLIEHLTVLPGQILNYTGRHPKYGLLTITGWTEFFLLHEAHHLFNIFILIRDWQGKMATGIN